MKIEKEISYLLAELNSLEREEAENYFFNAVLDFSEKIQVDGLVRIDRSSLFGPDNKQALFGRGSINYILSEDLDSDFFDLLKLRASYGVSGQRPGFDYQYETFTVTSQGVSQRRLGNNNLGPSIVKELEFGVDADFLKNWRFSGVYSIANVENEYIDVPLIAPAGFSSQWRNIGELKATALELGVAGYLINNDKFKWDVTLNWDKITQKITGLADVPDFTRSTSDGFTTDAGSSRIDSS